MFGLAWGHTADLCGTQRQNIFYQQLTERLNVYTPRAQSDLAYKTLFNKTKKMHKHNAELILVFNHK